MPQNRERINPAAYGYQKESLVHHPIINELISPFIKAFNAAIRNLEQWQFKDSGLLYACREKGNLYYTDHTTNRLVLHTAFSDASDILPLLSDSIIPYAEREVAKTHPDATILWKDMIPSQVFQYKQSACTPATPNERREARGDWVLATPDHAVILMNVPLTVDGKNTVTIEIPIAIRLKKQLGTTAHFLHLELLPADRSVEVMNIRGNLTIETTDASLQQPAIEPVTFPNTRYENMDHTAVLTFYKEVASRLHSGIDESSVVNAYYADSSRLQSRLEKNMKHGTFTFSGTWMNPTFRLLDDSEVSDLQAKSVRMYSQIPDPETARVVKFTLDAYSNQRHKATVILYFLVGIEAANNTLQIRLFAENFDDLKEALQRSSNRGKKATLKNILGAYSIPKQN